MNAAYNKGALSNMDKITQTREVPVIGSYDVVVCGGGPAGWIAAVASARNGARTAMIEQFGFPGGMATAGLVLPISVFTYNNKLVCGGIPWEFVNRMEAMGGAQVEKPLGNVAHDPEVYKLTAQRMLLEAGVQLHYHATVTGCSYENGHLTHVIMDTRSGPKALETRYVIDATGDGAICAMMHVPMQEAGDQPLQPASLIFCLGGVDTDNLPVAHHNLQGVNMHYVPLQRALRELAKTEEVPQFGGPWFCHIMHDGFVLVNATRTFADMTNHLDATAAECRLREDAYVLTEYFRRLDPVFQNCYLAYTAPVCGTRETRHIRGAHILTGEEYLNRVHFEDSIARSAHPIDIHSASDSQQRCTFLEDAAYIPYRCLVVPGFDNLIVPSRCLSADQIASASIRVQAPIMCLGQAAGLAAAMCARDGISVHDVDISAMREKLISWGVDI